jgi:hypothetical protein
MSTLPFALWCLTLPAGGQLAQLDVVKFCAANEYSVECVELINRLAEAKDAAALRRIIDADLGCSSWAVFHYAGLLDTKEALALCRRYEPLSSNWVSAFTSLGWRKKSDVIEYVKEVANSDHPYLRYYCYLVCEAQGWGELLELARQDLGSMIPLYLQGAKIGSVLGSTAYRYVRSVVGDEAARTLRAQAPPQPQPILTFTGEVYSLVQERLVPAPARPPVETLRRGTFCLR